VELTIENLADAAGVPVRTVRYYVGEGLIPGPGGRGRAAAYGDEHLLRLRLVRRLVEQRMPLAEIKTWVTGLPLRDVAELLEDEDRRSAQRSEKVTPKAYVSGLLDRARTLNERAAPIAALAAAPAPPTPRAGRPAERWTRWELAPGVELHVRADAADLERRLVRRVLDAARHQAPEAPQQENAHDPAR
jgi:Ca-activated chloride channel family protein